MGRGVKMRKEGELVQRVVRTMNMKHRRPLAVAVLVALFTGCATVRVDPVPSPDDLGRQIQFNSGNAELARQQVRRNLSKPRSALAQHTLAFLYGEFQAGDVLAGTTLADHILDSGQRYLAMLYLQQFVTKFDYPDRYTVTLAELEYEFRDYYNAHLHAKHVLDHAVVDDYRKRAGDIIRDLDRYRDPPR